MTLSPELLPGFRLNALRVEPLRGMVWGPAGKTTHLEPKVMEVLVCLSGHINKVATREQLIACVWPNTNGADNQLSRAISELRQSLDMTPGELPYIETSPKRGYRLIGEVKPLLPKTEAAVIRAEVSQQPRSSRWVLAMASFLCIVILAISYPQWERWRIGERNIGTAEEAPANGQDIGIKVIGTADEEAIKHYLQGMRLRALMGNEDLRSAEVSFRKALMIDSKFLKAKIELAYTYWAMYYIGEIERADAKNRIRPMVEELIKQLPADSIVVALDTFLGRDEGVAPEAAIADFTNAIAHQPWESRGYLHLAYFLWRNGRTDEALDWLNRGLVIVPNDVALKTAKARLLHFEGRLDEAGIAFAEVLQLNPGDATMLVGLADIDFAHGKYSDWFAKMLHAMESQPLDYEIPAHIAFCLYSMGLVAEADRYLRRAESIAVTRSRTRVAQLYKLVAQRDFEKARNLSEAMLLAGIDNRHGAFSHTLLVYVAMMDALERSAEIMGNLDQFIPGVTASEFQPHSELESIVRSYVILMRRYPPARDQDKSVLDEMEYWQFANSSGWRVPGEIEPSVALALGDHERAVNRIQIRLNTSMAFFWASLIMPGKGSSRFLSPLAQEPAVASRLADLAKDKQKAVEEISQYIADHGVYPQESSASPENGS